MGHVLAYSASVRLSLLSCTINNVMAIGGLSGMAADFAYFQEPGFNQKQFGYSGLRVFLSLALNFCVDFRSIPIGFRFSKSVDLGGKIPTSLCLTISSDAFRCGSAKGYCP
jgi:hypothetical protein